MDNEEDFGDDNEEVRVDGDYDDISDPTSQPTPSSDNNQNEAATITSTMPLVNDTGDDTVDTGDEDNDDDNTQAPKPHEEFRNLQAFWDNEEEPDDLAATFRRMCELVEQEVCEYYKLDPDPFDDRQPDEQNAVYSNSSLGRIMSEIDELFIDKLIDLYILPASLQQASSTTTTTVEGQSNSSINNNETLSLACRLLYNIIPASISFSFENDNMREAGSLLEKLLNLAKDADYDSYLKYYVLALLAQGPPNVESPFSNSSNHLAFEELAKSALKQLHKLKDETKKEFIGLSQNTERPFAQFSSPGNCSNTIARPSSSGSSRLLERDCLTPSSSKSNNAAGAKGNSTSTTPSRGVKRSLHQCSNNATCDQQCNGGGSTPSSMKKKSRRTSPNLADNLNTATSADASNQALVGSAINNSCGDVTTPQQSIKVAKKVTLNVEGERSDQQMNENSNSSWADVGPLYRGTYCLDPLTITMKQRILLQFLTPLAEYQELLSIFLEEQSLELINFYLEVSLHKDIRLTFEALRFLSGLLCHRRLAAKFVLSYDGLSRLVNVTRPSVAATAVSMCLFYIACCRDVFERALPQLHPNTIRDVCRYGLWLLECCTHESGRCHITMFFAEIFPFRCLLEAFDSMDGLRTLHNSITTLEVFTNVVSNAINDSVGLDEARSRLASSSSGRQLTVNNSHNNSFHHVNIPRGSDQQQLSFMMDSSFVVDSGESIRQAIKHYCVALKSYFSMHLAIKADQLKKSLKRSPLYLPAQPHKSADINRRIELKNMWFLLENVHLKANWPVVEHFLKLQGLQVLLQICSMAQEWKSYQFRADTLRNALDVMACITAHPKYQEQLCQTIEVRVLNPDLDDELQNQVALESVTGMKIILNLAEGIAVQDAEVQKSALRIIINCVCGPYGIQFTGLPGDQVLIGLGHPKLTGYPPNPQDEIMEKMWACVRSNHGLQVLLNLAITKSPSADAELLRSLACVGLYGLCLDDSIKQVVGKMPLLSQGLLEIAMREPPVQPDRMLDHQKFTHCGSALIDRVFSTRKYYNPFPSGARSIEELRRAEIVAQTRICWDPKELLALISEHLDSLGYVESAKTLFREAELASFYKMHKMKPIQLVPKPRIPPRLSVTVGQPGEPLEIVRLPSSQESLPSRLVSHTSSLSQPQRILFSNPQSSQNDPPSSSVIQTTASPSIPSNNKSSVPVNYSTIPGSPMSWPSRFKGSVQGSNCDSESVPSTPETYVSVKRQIQLSRGLASVPPPPSPLTCPTSLSSSLNLNTPTHPTSIDVNTSIDIDFSSNPNSAPINISSSSVQLNTQHDKCLQLPWRASVPNKCRTLNNIVESYLESQHAKCERPIVFCPPFSLKEQHKCPEPLYRTSAPLSAPKRLALRKVYAPHGGMEGSSFNRKLVHSRFRPIVTYSESNIDRGFFTSVAFSKCRSHFYVGTSLGEVRKYKCSHSDQTPVATYECHDTTIASIDLTTPNTNSHSTLMLTTVNWGSPGATLWKLSNEHDESCSKVMDFKDEMHCEFTKVVQDSVIGSVNEKAHIYDINTKTRIRSLYHPSYTNDYVMNMANGSYDSNYLVLNDGVLWDTRQTNPIHKYDKFNPNIAGQFHPNTLEVVINSEVWDLRTHKLLQTVPSLDQSLIWFNHSHDVIYSSGFTSLDEDRSLMMASSIKTIDACDYQTIATLDVKKKVGDVSIDPRDLYVAVIENGGNGGILHESGVCKIYEVGVPREPDQEDEDNSENDEDDEDDDEDDDDDDDDEDDDEAIIFDEILNNQLSLSTAAPTISNRHRNRGDGENGSTGSSRIGATARNNLSTDGDDGFEFYGHLEDYEDEDEDDEDEEEFDEEDDDDEFEDVTSSSSSSD